MFFRRVFALRERSRCFPSRALFSSITIKIFLTHGLSPPNSTLVIPRIFTAPIPPRLMKRRTVDSRKPIFEKDGVSLEIYSYLFFFLLSLSSLCSFSLPFFFLLSSFQLPPTSIALEGNMLGFPHRKVHKSIRMMRRQLINHHYWRSFIFLMESLMEERMIVVSGNRLKGNKFEKNI